jgi:hypothetical protein
VPHHNPVLMFTPSGLLKENDKLMGMWTRIGQCLYIWANVETSVLWIWRVDASIDSGTAANNVFWIDATWQ